MGIGTSGLAEPSTRRGLARGLPPRHHYPTAGFGSSRRERSALLPPHHAYPALATDPDLYSLFDNDYDDFNRNDQPASMAAHTTGSGAAPSTAPAPIRHIAVCASAPPLDVRARIQELTHVHAVI